MVDVLQAIEIPAPKLAVGVHRVFPGLGIPFPDLAGPGVPVPILELFRPHAVVQAEGG
jgi:hypothetical protein